MKTERLESSPSQQARWCVDPPNRERRACKYSQKGGTIMSQTQPYKTVMLNPHDHVAVALEPIPAGSVVSVTCQGRTFSVTLNDPIDFGHKFAVVPIAKDSDVRKYGEVIGIATRDISPGEHVHVHNIEGKRARGDLRGIK